MKTQVSKSIREYTQTILIPETNTSYRSISGKRNIPFTFGQHIVVTWSNNVIIRKHGEYTNIPVLVNDIAVTQIPVPVCPSKSKHVPVRTQTQTSVPSTGTRPSPD